MRWHLQPDGKILVGGRYLNADGSQSFSLTRLNADGSFDPGFTGAGTNGVSSDSVVNAIALQADGRIVIGGDFLVLNVVSGRGGIGRPGLARLNTDGGVDDGFVPDKPGADTIFSVAVQPDGKVLYASTTFVSFFAPPDRRVAGVFRLNADGSRDSTFPGLGYYDGDFYAVALQPDGKILYGGDGIRSAGVGDVGRLDASGNLDRTFFTDVRARPTYALALQPADGRIVIGGDFLSVNGTARSSLARLTNDAGGAAAFFTGAVSVGNGFKYLVFPNGTVFGYYSDASFPFIYHDDLGFEYVINAGNARGGVYLYDFKLGVFFYTDPTIFPYLYNFGTQSFFYYFPDANRPGHYTTNPRVFYNFGNGQFVFSP